VKLHENRKYICDLKLGVTCKACPHSIPHVFYEGEGLRSRLGHCESSCGVYKGTNSCKPYYDGDTNEERDKD
jgi:hypothetical protein